MLNPERLVHSMLAWSAIFLTMAFSAVAWAAPPPQKAKPAAAPAAKSAAPSHAAAAPHGTAPHAGGKPQVKEDKALTTAYKSYVEAIRQRIYNTWYEKLPLDGKNHVLMTVIISPDGSAGDMQLTSTPKNGAAEQAAQEAFNSVQPLSPLPSGSPACKLTVTMDSTGYPPADVKTNFAIKMDPVSGGSYTPAAPASAPEPKEEPKEEPKADDKK